MMAVIQFINTIASGFKYLADCQKRAKESAESISASYKELQQEIQEGSNSLSELVKQYNELSKGVDQFGNNVSLSTEQYSQYTDVCSKLKDILPTLSSGFNTQGDAIIYAKNQLIDYNSELDNYKRKRAKELYNEREDGWLFFKGQRKTESVYQNFENNIIKDRNLSSKDNYSSYSYNGDASTTQKIQILEKILKYGTNLKELDKLYKFTEANTTNEDNTTNEYESMLFNKLSIIAYSNGNNGSFSNFSKNEYAEVYQSLKEEYEELKDKTEEYLQPLKESAALYATTRPDYYVLSDKSQNNILTILNNMNSQFVAENELTTEESMNSFINNMISTLLENKDNVDDAFNKLLDFDINNSSLNPVEAKKQIDKLVEQIAQTFDVDPIQLKIFLGLDLSNLEDQYTKARDLLANKFYDKNAVGDKAVSESKQQIKEQFDQFASEYSINTEEEIAFWNQCIEESKTLQEAEQKYIDHLSTTEGSVGNTVKKSFKEALKESPDIKKKLFDLAKSGEITPETLESTEEYKKLIDECGLSAEEATNKIREMTLKEVDKDLNNYEQVLEKVRNGQALSIEEMSVLIDKTPSLASSVKKVGDAYSLEEDALINVINTSKEYHNNIIADQVNTTKSTIDEIKKRIKALKLELKALTTVAQSREEIQNNINAPSNPINNATNPNSIPGMTSEIKNNLTNNAAKGINDEISEQYKQLEEAEKELEGFDTKFEELLKTDSDTSKDNSSKSSSDPTTFDWIEVKLNKLEAKVQKTIDKISDYTSKPNKNKLYKNAIKQYDALIEADNKAAKVYEEKFKKISFSKNKKKNAEWQEKIKSGAYSIDDIKNEKLAKRIEKAQGYWDKRNDALDSAFENTQKRRDLNKQKLEDDISYYENELDALQYKEEHINNRISKKETLGFIQNKKDYKDQISNSKKQVEQWKKEIKVYEDYLKANNISKSSSEYMEIKQTIRDINTNILNAEASQLEWNKAISELPLTYLSNLESLIGSITTKYESLLSLWEAQGRKKNENQIEKDIFLLFNENDNLEDQVDATWNRITDMFTSKVNSKSLGKEYANSLKQLWKSYQDGDISLDDFKYRVSRAIPFLDSDTFDSWEELQKKLEEVNSLNSEILNNKTEIEKAYDEIADLRINALNELIDKMKEFNDQQSKAIELEKLQQALQNARQNKTSLIYREGIGFNYEAKQEDVFKAQQDLDEYYNKEQLEQLQKLVDILSDLKENYNFFDENGRSLVDEALKSLIGQRVFSTTDAVTDAIDKTVQKLLAAITNKVSLQNIEFTIDEKGQVVAKTKEKYAKGTLNAKGGLSLVGEQGAELRVLNSGDGILTADVTKNLLKFGLNPEKEIMKQLEKINIPNKAIMLAPQNNNVSTINIGTVSLPNINDLSKAQDLFNELSKIDSTANQRVYR